MTGSNGSLAEEQARSMVRWIEFAGGKQAATGIFSPRQVYAHRAFCPDTQGEFGEFGDRLLNSLIQFCRPAD